MNFKDRYIDVAASLLEALKLMDSIDKKLLIVLKKGNFMGLLSIGDIQRAIIRNVDLSAKVEEVMRKNFRYASHNSSVDDVKSMMIYHRMELCPVLDDNLHLVNLYFWEDLFEVESPMLTTFNLPVVIMAGGLGTRLRPLTYIIPKPLIPIGEKTMLEEIFNRFHQYGCSSFFISVNYKSDLIQFYLNSLKLPFQTQCFSEEKPLGTAGSLHLLKGKINETFFVSNCDILIEDDYSNILKYHRENGNEITLVAALKHLPISYGTLETGEEGQLISMKEKPEITFKINSGMYILEPHLLDEIPENEHFHITQLIEQILQRKGRVGVFPVSEKSWKDIGEFKELSKYLYR